MEDKVLIADPLEQGAIDLLKASGLACEVKTGLAPQTLLQEVASGYTALLVRSQSRVTREVIEAARGLKIVGRAGVGVDNIDVTAASERGVLVCNAPEGNTIAAAEHTMALILALARHVPDAHASMRAGKWDRKSFMGVELLGKTLGVVGMGKIGRTVASRAKAFGMEVLGYDPFVSQEMSRSLGVEPVALDDLLARSDVITLHIPATDETRGLLDGAAIDRMKRGVRIVNCARGGIVDESALAEALASGRVAGAALDVFESEPPAPGSPILAAPNAILTPHLGASTREAQEKVGIEVAQQIVDYLRHGTVRFAVNAPALAPELQRALSPYMDLATRLGRFQAQLVRGNLRSIDIEYRGDFTQHSTRPITTSLLAGFLSCLTDEPVNFVNAGVLVKKRGIVVNEARSSEQEDFARLISVTFATDLERRTVAGTLYGAGNPRIVRLDSYYFDAIPAGCLLLVSNIDRAGVVGNIGTIMGRHGINIASLSLGRDKPAGHALAIINVDSPVPDEVESELLSQEHVKWVKSICL